MQDMHRLAGETGISVPTIRKWLDDPASVTRGAAYALEQGARKLRLDVEGPTRTDAKDGRR
jgi:hypothetical protein